MILTLAMPQFLISCLTSEREEESSSFSSSHLLEITINSGPDPLVTWIVPVFNGRATDRRWPDTYRISLFFPWERTKKERYNDAERMPRYRAKKRILLCSARDRCSCEPRYRVHCGLRRKRELLGRDVAPRRISETRHTLRISRRMCSRSSSRRAGKGTWSLLATPYLLDSSYTGCLM